MAQGQAGDSESLIIYFLLLLTYTFVDRRNRLFQLLLFLMGKVGNRSSNLGC